MRILYFDIDSLRPDHLGCYGYHRATSPNIDRIASQGVRFENYYASDVPCLPSRTAQWSGRFGIHNGVVNHGGVAAEPFIEGPSRGFSSVLGDTGWMRCLRNQGLKTATISTFGERHSAWHWYANFNEIYNLGQGGMERADEVFPVALDWLDRHAEFDNWFLHVNMWDPHTPYRTPAEFGNPFAEEPLPGWLSEEVRAAHWNGCGPHSAREVGGYDCIDGGSDFPGQPSVMNDMAAVRKMFDGYDCGVRYADAYIGLLLDALEQQGALDETAIIISGDHGENLGELNIYGDHQTADQLTARVPLIVKWPGITDTQAGRADDALHYQVDFAATTIELLGGQVPDNWDGRSFAPALLGGESVGRDFLVLSQGAWSCQRAIRFDRYLCVRSYHDGHHDFPDVMLFDLQSDPHEQHDLAPSHPQIVDAALRRLDQWHGEMMLTATHPVDPLWTVLHEGGPLHTRGELPRYLQRLRETGRPHCAEALSARHGNG